MRAKKLKTEGSTGGKLRKRSGGESPIKREAYILPALLRARISLDIPDTFKPAFPVQYLFNVMKPAPTTCDLIEYLRYSDEKSAKTICDLYDNRLVQVERDAVSLDDLIFAARADPAAIFGLLTSEMFRQNTLKTQLLASFAAPAVMQSVIDRAQTPIGHQDAKMLLQAVGAAPVPKNQTLVLNNSGSMAFNKQVNITTGDSAGLRLEDIVRDMDSLDAPVTIHALPTAVVEEDNDDDE